MTVQLLVYVITTLFTIIVAIIPIKAFWME